MRQIRVVRLRWKRRAITRRDWKRDWRRGARRRVWVGSRARASAARPLFFSLSAQQVKRARPADWFGAAAMLLGVASWGVLAALLGS
ncbi:MAG: hypothetical protein ACREKQ_16430 [Candidatus Rokuibacteriota bacterium]